MAVEPRFGFAAKLYLGTGTAAPTLTEVSNVRDVHVNADGENVEAWYRTSGQFKTFEPTGLTLEVTGKVRADKNDTTGFIAMRTAFLTAGGTELDVIALNGASTSNGAVGVRFGGKVGKFGADQSNAQVQDHEFSIKPCISANKVQTVTVTSGAPVYTDLN